MYASGDNTIRMKANGVIQCVDTLKREMTAIVDGRPTTFDIPIDCGIILNGERVKLRLLQSGDRVAVTHSCVRDVRAAFCIEAGPRDSVADHARGVGALDIFNGIP